MRAVSEVVVYINDVTKRQFEAKRNSLRAAGKPTNEIWVFHGTNKQKDIDSIMRGGFKVGGKGVAVKNGPRYGHGVYAATEPNTPMRGYAGRTSSVILCRALPGLEGPQGGSGVDMWRPKTDWTVFADPHSLLPVYVLRYKRW